MHKCDYCGAETRLFLCNRPICVACSDKIARGEKPIRKQQPLKAKQAHA